MSSNQFKAPCMVNHMSNGLIELISLAELDAIMLTMLTPNKNNKREVNEFCLSSFEHTET
ncbi:hypothetical protein [Shewanella denitrificans]|jgi:hypothetical protein|uniref:hypothetical protein n=1 Tax=Shewanella denitrificans TaxID=192073 RepID=UPI00031B975F|nr:hypothetical protein [Shewanella denitrificans]